MKPIVLILIIIVAVGVLWTIWDLVPEKELPFTPESATTLVIGYTKRELARELGVSADDIRLVSNTKRDWPDGCLGIQKQGVMCTQVITPGFIIVLEAGGKQYTYRTNQNGTYIVPQR